MIERLLILGVCGLLAGTSAAQTDLVQDPNFPLIRLPAEYQSGRTTKRFDPKPGEGVAILDQIGPGAVRHFWITSTAPEQLQIEITYDGAKEPHVKMKMDHFSSGQISDSL